ncbi:hypothetical protein [Sphingomonas oryzagri]|uniref:Uncharacterized protein n=1 Tax=Sphingomonas oryzagri TaxID=3042314 RepID=A0ABT6N620_9SPHN|nr:hypothetical protein [Sphingomonas oryzagri]MDH7640552.1 hypothetical protein [Sphingomonas oryzagri]
MTKSVLDGHAAANPGPYLNDRQRLAALAVQLRDNRAGQYEAMIAKGQISENDAFRDSLARQSIATDWTAIINQTARPSEPWARNAECCWCLHEVLRSQEDRLAPMHETHDGYFEAVALRDTIAALLQHYRTKWVWILLGEAERRAAAPQAMRGAA